MRFPNLDRIWTESGRGRSTGGRGRSNEIEGDPTDFADLRRSSPIFADLRSFSPASGVLDPIWAILKPLNYSFGSPLRSLHVKKLGPPGSPQGAKK